MTLPKILSQPSTRVNKSLKLKDLQTLLHHDVLPKVEEEFEIVETLHQGTFSRIYLAQKGKEKFVLKSIRTEDGEDFYRELSYAYFLSPHPNVVKCFKVSMSLEDEEEGNRFLLFPMEQATWGNLRKYVTTTPKFLTEARIKIVMKQLASALDFIHSLKLVHRDLTADNVLVFQRDLSHIKLSDFGSTRPEKSLVLSVKEEGDRDPYQFPPEVWHLVKGESYHCHRSEDVWQLGILLYLLLTGGMEPWVASDEMLDPFYHEWFHWVKRKNLRVPEPFTFCTPRLLRLFKRVFQHNPKKRCEAREFLKYLEDDWILSSGRVSPLFRLERKVSSSTNRSRSSAGTESLKIRKSLRSNFSSRSLNLHPSRGRSNLTPSPTSRSLSLRVPMGRRMMRNSVRTVSGGESCGGSGIKDKLSHVDRDFVKERVGQWVIHASNSVNHLTVPDSKP